MSNTWGERIKISIFGESHNKAVGIIMGGIPSGIKISEEEILKEMQRRAPGRDVFSTQRKETDIPEIQSGIFNGYTTGSPICGIIKNSDVRSRDYDTKMRPGHADITAFQKYGGFADMRGGGHFSGRLTAPLVFAGAIAKQALVAKGIKVYGRIVSIGNITDHSDINEEDYFKTHLQGFQVFDPQKSKEMQQVILDAKEDGDSVGGIIEACVFNCKPGLGEPFFYSAESAIAAMLFSVPAVKGVEFGDGFGIASLRGSQANDPIEIKDGIPHTTTNHNGGILGGITNGNTLKVRVAIKPTPSIAIKQNTVDAKTMSNTEISVKGRHDPCIVQRAVPVIEAGIALSILDLLLL